MEESVCGFDKPMREKVQLMVKQWSSEIVETTEELRKTFSKIDTSEREGAEKLQLSVTLGWDKKEVRRSKRWDLGSVVSFG